LADEAVDLVVGVLDVSFDEVGLGKEGGAIAVDCIGWGMVVNCFMWRWVVVLQRGDYGAV